MIEDILREILKPDADGIQGPLRLNRGEGGKTKAAEMIASHLPERFLGSSLPPHGSDVPFPGQTGVPLSSKYNLKNQCFWFGKKRTLWTRFPLFDNLSLLFFRDGSALIIRAKTRDRHACAFPVIFHLLGASFDLTDGEAIRLEDPGFDAWEGVPRWLPLVRMRGNTHPRLYLSPMEAGRRVGEDISPLTDDCAISKSYRDALIRDVRAIEAYVNAPHTLVRPEGGHPLQVESGDGCFEIWPEYLPHSGMKHGELSDITLYFKGMLQAFHDLVPTMDGAIRYRFLASGERHPIELSTPWASIVPNRLHGETALMNRAIATNSLIPFDRITATVSKDALDTGEDLLGLPAVLSSGKGAPEWASSHERLRAVQLFRKHTDPRVLEDLQAFANGSAPG